MHINFFFIYNSLIEFYLQASIINILCFKMIHLRKIGNVFQVHKC